MASPKRETPEERYWKFEAEGACSKQPADACLLCAIGAIREAERDGRRQALEELIAEYETNAPDGYHWSDIAAWMRRKLEAE